MEEHITLNYNSLKLHAVVEFPEHQHKKMPMVLIFHGLFSDSRCPLLVSVKDFLLEQGFVTLRLDFSGFGLSEGKHEDMTVPDQIRQAEAALDYVKGLPFVSKVFLLGHSQGGVVASSLAGLFPAAVDGLMLFNPAGVIEDSMNAGLLVNKPFDAEHIPETIELGGRTFGRAYMESGKSLRIFETAAAFQGPVCLICGDRDERIPVAYFRKYHRIYRNCSFRLILGADHVFRGCDLSWKNALLPYVTKYGTVIC